MAPIDEKLCDERHDKLSEELTTFREHCEKQHASNEGQIVRIHDRLDAAQASMERLKEAMHQCFHSATKYFIYAAACIIVTLIGTIVTLAVGQVSKKTEVVELEKKMAVQFQVSENNNQMLRALIDEQRKK